VCVSQHVPIRELSGILFPHNSGERFLMLIVGYIDESANKKVFTLSCILTTPAKWTDIERKWKAVLRATNKALRRQGRQQISRYHAADCSSCKGDFAGWSVAEQIDFSKKLIAIIKYGMTTVMAYSMPLEDFVAVYPEYSEHPEKGMHGLLLKYMMTQLIHDIEKQAEGAPLKPYKIAFIHDRSDRDGDMLAAFNQMKDDETFKGRDHFATIASMGWEDCVPLQAADLLAYETFKDASNRIAPNPRPRRKSLESLFEANTLFGGHSLSFNRKAVEVMRQILESSSKSWGWKP
jgi:hypothetical protein